MGRKRFTGSGPPPGWVKLKTDMTLRCPQCNTVGKVRVYDTRQTEEGYTRRRRGCGSCNFRYTTVEVPEWERKGYHLKDVTNDELLAEIRRRFGGKEVAGADAAE